MTLSEIYTLINQAAVFAKQGSTVKVTITMKEESIDYSIHIKPPEEPKDNQSIPANPKE